MPTSLLLARGVACAVLTRGGRAAEAHLDGLAARLGRRRDVRRPEPLDHDRAIATADLVVASGYAQAFPRRVLLVIGDEIIEAPMAQQSRHYEYRAYRPDPTRCTTARRDPLARDLGAVVAASSMPWCEL